MKVARSLAFLASLLLAGFATHAAFPDKPVRLVVPFAPGGGTDLIARTLGQGMAKELGQPVVIENKAGAGGNLGTDFVAKSEPDGSTILAGYTGPITVNVTLFGNLPYDPQKDLAPITLAVTTPQFLTVNPGVPFNSVLANLYRDGRDAMGAHDHSFHVSEFERRARPS